jgi:hypothetical protein
MLLISQTLLNPMYEYVAVAVKIRVQHTAFRTVRRKTADNSPEAAITVPEYVV